MIERYNSEKDIKSKFDNFEMSFDNEAFEKFQDALDKENDKKKFAWWFFYGKMVVPVLVLGLIIFGAVNYIDIDDNNALSSAIDHKTNLNLQTHANEPAEVTTKKVVNSQASISSPDASFTALDAIRNEDNFAAAKLIPSSNQALDSGDYQKTTSNLRLENNKRYPGSEFPLVSESSMENESSRVSSHPMMTRIPLLYPLKSTSLRSMSDKEQVIIEDIALYKEKFKPYFYFRMGAGYTIEDNFGVNDPYFELSKTNEMLWQASVAYQWKRNTAFELSYIRKGQSLGFSMKDFIYTGKVGSNVNIIKVGLNNRLFSGNAKLKLYMTNGISMVIVSNSFNDSPDFSKENEGPNLPTNISNINFEWEGLYSNNHFMYSSGLNLDYQLARNLELKFSAEYSFGFKPVMKANLKYIEGEGIIKNVETHTNSSFALFSLGLKYSLRND